VAIFAGCDFVRHFRRQINRADAFFSVRCRGSESKSCYPTRPSVSSAMGNPLIVGLPEYPDNAPVRLRMMRSRLMMGTIQVRNAN